MHKKFCIAPFHSIKVAADGAVSPCCKYYEPSREMLGNIKHENIIQILNGDRAKELRKHFLSDKDHLPSGCSLCATTEDMGGESLRINLTRIFENEIAHISSRFNLDGSMNEFLIKHAEIAFSNLCNHACEMCESHFSTTFSTAVLQNKKLKDYYKLKELDTKILKCYSTENNNLDELIQHIAQYSHHVVISGGEPLMDSNFKKILKLAKEKDPNKVICFATNLSKLQHGALHIIEDLKTFKEVYIGVSIEGIPEIHNKIRIGSDCENVIRNIKTIQSESKNIFISVNMTVNADNVPTLAEGIQFVLDNAKPNNVRLTVVENCDYCMDNLPEDVRLKSALELETLLPKLKVDFNWSANEAAFRSDIQAVINRLRNPIHPNPILLEQFNEAWNGVSQIHEEK